jgi:putative endonuclease
MRHPRVTASPLSLEVRALRCTCTAGRASKDDWVGIYIYMLRCADGSYYVGNATGHDLSTRIDQHNAGSYPGYTFSRRPVVLVWSEYFDRITDGIAVERQIKGWSRAKKEALIGSDWSNLSKLSRRRAGKPRDD